MKNEFKRAMKLVWGNKRLRGTFGCGFGMNLNECGWLLVLMGLCAVAPLASLLFGVQLSEIWILRLLKNALISLLILCLSMMNRVYRINTNNLKQMQSPRVAASFCFVDIVSLY